MRGVQVPRARLLRAIESLRSRKPGCPSPRLDSLVERLRSEDFVIDISELAAVLFESCYDSRDVYEVLVNSGIIISAAETGIAAQKIAEAIDKLYWMHVAKRRGVRV